jgi:nucleotide-binding universal stress UspA family protein
MQEIVVGVDGSPASDAALRYAVEEAEVHGCRLVAVHAWSTTALVAGAFAPMPPFDLGEMEGAAKEVLANACAPVLGEEGERRLEVEICPMCGHPPEMLVRRAARARELVVGSRRRGGFTGLFLGSVSQQCVHHAPCPVVIVPAPRS